jgi:FkbM family methyltransferase
MKKIFIDCGANNGCSVKLFSKVFSDYQDYFVYSFECSDTFYSQLVTNGSSIELKSFNPMKKAVWISNGKKKYDGWQLVDTKNENDNDGVESIDISEFIINNFSKEDYIVFKIDIEGAEYKVIDKMYKDGTLSYINEFYGELHGPKKGYTEKDNVELLDKLNEFGLMMYNWDAIDATSFEKIQIVPFDTEGSFTNKSSLRVGHAYKRIM